MRSEATIERLAGTETRDLAAHSARMSKMRQKWEYMLTDMLRGPREQDERYLNELGQEEWELVSTIPDASGGIKLAILKRPQC